MSRTWGGPSPGERSTRATAARRGASTREISDGRFRVSRDSSAGGERSRWRTLKPDLKGHFRYRLFFCEPRAAIAAGLHPSSEEENHEASLPLHRDHVRSP